MNIKIKRYQEISEPEQLSSFKILNQKWIIEYYNTIPAMDLKILDNPKKEIIDKGGQILFANSGSTSIGTVALVPHKDGLEIAKLAVDPNYRNMGVGGQLVARAIREAKILGHHSVYLYTNAKKLPAAFSLYQKLGFIVEETLVENPRCETKMTREL